VSERLRQEIRNSPNSRQAGRDIIENYNVYAQTVRPFYEKDIKDLVIAFSKCVGELKETAATSLPNERSIEHKNEVNGLTAEYFEMIVDKHLPYFQRIRDFLSDPKNIEYLDMYNSTVHDLQFATVAARSEYRTFDQVLQQVYALVIKKCGDAIRPVRHLALVFLHYMYYNCDIGENDVKTS